MTAREYSKRLGLISDAQFQAALQRFGLGDFVVAEAIPFGLFGQNLFLTSTQGEFVLRGTSHYDWQFPAEHFFAELLHNKTNVPVPYPYLFEPSPEIFGWSYILMPCMAGIQLADAKVAAALPQADRQAISRALAQTLIEAQTLTWDYAGRYDLKSNTIAPLGEDYRQWVLGRIRALLAQAQGLNDNTPESDAKWVKRLIAANSEGMDAPYQPCVVFEDYKEPNTVAEKTEMGWRISGLFDLMTTHFGDGEADLARLVGSYLREQPNLANTFVDEYLRNKPVAKGFAQRQRLYMLYDSLLIWAFWQGHTGGFPEDKTLTLERWAAPFINYWDRYSHVGR
jgi:hygromycin-B 7''-O-kinase